MRPLIKAIGAICDWVGKVASTLVLIIMLILMYETIMRYLFNAPSTWAHEISGDLAGLFFLFGGAYTLAKRGHVAMDVVYSHFPLRVRAIVDLLTATLFFLFCGVLFWKGLDYSWGSLMILENSGAPLYFPVYPFKLALPIAAFLLLLQGSAKFICDLMTAITGKAYEH